MRISDGSSDVCSSDLMRRLIRDAPLRKSSLERTLALLRDIPGQTVDARLRQSGAPGDLLIDLIVKRKQVQIGLTIDNSGVSNVVKGVQAQMSVTVNGLVREIGRASCGERGGENG